MTIKFETYEAACEWFEAGQAKYGKRGFTATQEYRDGYANFAALSAERRATERKAADQRKAYCDQKNGKPVNLLARGMV